MGQANSPRVSVVMAVYNGAPYLGDTVRSILGQTFSNFEFLIVDDGSTDGSRDIVLSFDDRRIRLIKNESNEGLARSLNRGISAAVGEFVARIDADDLAFKNRLYRQVTYLDDHPEIALAGSGFREIREGRAGRRLRYPEQQAVLQWSLMFFCPFVHSAMMWRRALVGTQVGGYDERFRYAMDWEFWSRIGCRLGISNTSDILVQYRLGPHSMTSTHPDVPKEVQEARRVSVGLVFGEAGAKRWWEEAPVLYPIIDGWDASSTTIQTIRTSISTIISLQSEFEKVMGLRGEKLDYFRKWVRGWMARQLLYRARKAHRAQYRDLGKMLLAEALRVEPRLIGSADFGRYLLIRAAGPMLKGRSF